MVTTLLVDDDVALRFREAVKKKYAPRAWGRITEETTKALENHIKLLEGFNPEA